MQSLAEFLFRAQRRGELPFLLIGGRSLEAHGYVRNTKDVDFLVATHDIPVMERLLMSIGIAKTQRRKYSPAGNTSLWKRKTWT